MGTPTEKEAGRERERERERERDEHAHSLLLLLCIITRDIFSSLQLGTYFVYYFDLLSLHKVFNASKH